MKKLINLICIALIALISCNKSIGHTCKWELCPYKGVTYNNAIPSVIAYVGESGTDAYCLALLHIQYPTYQYEQLEELLIK